MSNVLSRTVVLAAALVSVVVLELQVRAEDKPSEKLALESGYSGKVLIDGARRVSLSVTLDAKGSGSGTLRFDPNILDGDTSTSAAIRKIPIRIQLAPDEAQAAKGRRLFELKRKGDEDKVVEGGVRLMALTFSTPSS